MKFHELALAFDAIEQESSRNKITELLAGVLKHARPVEAQDVAYFSLGDLDAVYVGTKFNFAEKSMLRVLAKLCHDSQKDLVADAKKIGDLGAAVATHSWHRTQDEQLTVHQVHEQLEKFASLSGSGSQEEKEAFMEALLHKLEPISAKYVIRIVLGKLRLGFSDMTLLDAFSWMETGDKSLRKKLEQAYNISADIGHIIKVLKEDGLAGIEKQTIEPGVPIRPAAAERLATPEAIVKKLGPCVTQPKLDGFRLQIHVDKRTSKPKIHFYSRNLQDMSDMFPELRDSVVGLKGETIVAEGEAIAYDTQTGSFLPFQETVKRKRKHNIEEMAQEFPLKLYLFDLLYLDGESYLEKTHIERRKKLAEVIKVPEVKRADVIHLIDEVEIEEHEKLEDYFEEHISLGLEGLVAKRPDAAYQPGKRNFNWIKLKRKETGEIDDTLDCVILGYYQGRGKRASFGIGVLLVGVFNSQEDRFETIAKIGTGLTDQQWRDQKKMCDDLAIQEKPHNVVCAKDLFPDVWVTPEIVCMVRADEITRSPIHTAGATKDASGYALRFPRLMGYRDDKSASDATTVYEVEELFDLQFQGKTQKKKTSAKQGQKSIF